MLLGIPIFVVTILPERTAKKHRFIALSCSSEQLEPALRAELCCVRAIDVRVVVHYGWIDADNCSCGEGYAAVRFVREAWRRRDGDALPRAVLLVCMVERR